MRHINFFLGVLMSFVALATSASAAPMGFKNSWMIMGDTSKNFQELAFNYATTANDAFGLSVSGMESHHSMRQQNVEVVYTRKVARWNMPNAQANIWFIGGIGSTTGNTFTGSRLTTSPGVQADYETTRVYVMGSTRVYTGEGPTSTINTFRLGGSFYEVHYDQPQPWLIVEARRMNFVSRQYEITPMLRVIHNRYFVEFGANMSGQPRFNFMYNY
jgi:hypothetical protein